MILAAGYWHLVILIYKSQHPPSVTDLTSDGVHGLFITGSTAPRRKKIVESRQIWLLSRRLGFFFPHPGIFEDWFWWCCCRGGIAHMLRYISAWRLCCRVSPAGLPHAGPWPRLARGERHLHLRLCASHTEIWPFDSLAFGLAGLGPSYVNLQGGEFSNRIQCQALVLCSLMKRISLLIEEDAFYHRCDHFE